MNTHSTPRSRWYRTLLPAFVWAVAIFVASSIPSQDLPAQDIFEYDKLIHMAIYFVFAALLYRALRFEGTSRAMRSRAAMVTVAIIAFYGMTDEFHQYFVPGRSMDFFDWVADVSGGILCVLVMSYLSRRNPRKDESPVS
jgi:VanZ family protein